MTSIVNKTNPILSFDFPEFLENGEMMCREQILKRLAKDNYILHSMPPFSREKFDSKYDGKNSIFPNLTIYRNHRWLPYFHRFQILNKISNSLRRFHRRYIIKKITSKKPILYIWHPYFSDEIGKYKEAIVIYHIYDDYRNYQDVDKKIIAKREDKIIESADIIISVSNSLAKNIEKKYKKKVFFIPHGIDFDLYQNHREKGAVCPLDMQGIKKPRIGYIGRFNTKVDIDLLEFIATAKPEWNFILIGPAANNSIAKMSKLDKLHNIYFIGSRKPDELPSYYMNMDVNLLAYKFGTELWYKNIHPLKMYEVLAAGKPVVSTPLTEITKFTNLFRFANTKAEWIDCIQSCLENEQTNEFVQEMLKEAQINTWEKRVIDIKSIISNHLLG